MSWEKRFQKWKNYKGLDEFVQDDLNRMENHQTELEDAFYKNLEFGTAGMRGILGAGTNRMNIYTVRQATEGLAQFIEKRGTDAKDKGVAIAYDSRRFSKAFALEAAKTLGHHQIKSYVFKDLRPTPELSFAVRHLNAEAGIMITASHNPPEYNGYKVYGSDGAQMLPKQAKELTDLVNQIENPLDIQVADLEAITSQGLMTIIGSKVDKAYLELMKGVSVDPSLIERTANKLSIVFTPLHGTGKYLGEKALWNAGFKHIHLVESQAEPDAEFSTVESPNPEERAAFEKAIALGKEVDADILVATDPDADRLGLAVKLSQGNYEVLTGNQIASLLIDYILRKQVSLDTFQNHSVIVKSLVSSNLPDAIGEKFGVQTQEVLTGFKYIADKINQFEAEDSKFFLFGFEESYGYLFQPFVRDKDAIQALILVAEMAAYYKEKGMGVYDGLLNLYYEHGHFIEKTLSIKMAGKEGSKKIDKLIKEFRDDPFTEFAGLKVERVDDYSTSIWQDAQGNKGSIELPQANVIKYHFTGGTWLAVRPSGTEPKIKIYLAVQDGAKYEADEKLETMEQAIAELVDNLS